MSVTPEAFRAALDLFMEQVYLKAVRRAKEKHRPFDPWNEYHPNFIRGRLIEEIGEFLAKTGQTGGWKGSPQEDDELYDMAALACSLWMANRPENEYRGLKDNSK